jgi:hypothetical protein
MTIVDTISNGKDKPFDFNDNSQVIPIEVLLNYRIIGFKLVPTNTDSKIPATAKEIDQYVPVNVYNVQCFQVCGFEFRFCKYMVGLDPETGYWILDDQGELSN